MNEFVSLLSAHAVKKGRYLRHDEHKASLRRPDSNLRVRCGWMGRQEVTGGRRIIQRRDRHRGMSQLAGGLLLGAIVAGGLVKGLLELKEKRERNEVRNIFSWPALSGTGRRHR